VKPFQSSEIVPAIEVALARFTEHRAIEDEAATSGDGTASVENKLETRRLVDQAKAVLMDSHDMSEMDAFSFIQRSAMDRRIRMQQVAREVLDGTLTP
ncbi:MAG: ANTAR domain-containing protein, partial [Acidimicrobiales bacterium]